MWSCSVAAKIGSNESNRFVLYVILLYTLQNVVDIQAIPPIDLFQPEPEKFVLSYLIDYAFVRNIAPGYVFVQHQLEYISYLNIRPPSEDKRVVVFLQIPIPVHSNQLIEVVIVHS